MNRSTRYENIGGHEAFSRWTADNPTESYRIAARLISTEIKSSDGEERTAIVNRSGTVIDQPDDAELVTSPGRTQVFQKRSQKTARPDLELGESRYADLLKWRREEGL